MLRMEIALFLVLAFVAYIYFSAEKQYTQLHRIFSALLVTALVHLVLDGITVHTVNHLDTVPRLLNDAVHRLFIGSMVLVIYLFYQYIAILVEEETGKPRGWTGRRSCFWRLRCLAASCCPSSTCAPPPETTPPGCMSRCLTGP